MVAFTIISLEPEDLVAVNFDIKSEPLLNIAGALYFCILYYCVQKVVTRRNPDLLDIHSSLYNFALRFIVIQTHATSYSYCTL